MPATPPILAVAAENRWLLAFSLSALVVLAAGILTRRRARVAERKAPGSGGVRRRAGAAIALGPLVGLACAPSFDDRALVIAVGAAVLAAFGMLVERSRDADRLTFGASVVAGVVAAVAGAQLGPSGVEVLDVVGAIAL